MKTITSFSVRIGLTSFLNGNLFVYEGYIATSYVIIVNGTLKVVERHKQTTIDIKRQHWGKKGGRVENTYIYLRNQIFIRPIGRLNI